MSDDPNEGGGAGGGGAGGDGVTPASAAGLLGAAAEGGGGGAGGAGGGAGGSGDGQKGEAPDWWGTLADTAPDKKTPSDRKWIENKGFKSPAEAIAAYRQLENQFGSGEKLVLPKDANDADGWNRVFTALGRPEAPEGYDAKPLGDQVDPAFFGEFAKAAHAAGLTQRQVEAVAEFNNQQLAAAATAQAQREKAEGAELRKTHGAALETMMAHTDRALAAYGFTEQEAIAMRQALGVKRSLEFFAKLGSGMAEDGLPGNGNKGGGGDLATMLQRKQQIIKDPELAGKLRNGDPALKAEWDAINAAEAAQLEAQRRVA
jgi:hypothetical protein